jgi:hypothetical protein
MSVTHCDTQRADPTRRFTWVAFIAQATVVGNSIGGDAEQGDPVAVYWGQATWLVLAAAVVHLGWGYEAVRWRVQLLK